MLSPKQRKAVLAGDPITLLEEPGREVGQMIELTSRVSVRLEKKVKRKGQRSFEYTVIDNRDRFLRATLPRQGKPDREGTLNAAAIAIAAEASAYDANPRDPIGGGSVVPIEYQRLITARAHGQDAARRQAEHAETTAREAVRGLNVYLREVTVRAARNGVDPTPFIAQAKRAFRLLEQELDEAA